MQQINMFAVGQKPLKDMSVDEITRQIEEQSCEYLQNIPYKTWKDKTRKLAWRVWQETHWYNREVEFVPKRTKGKYCVMGVDDLKTIQIPVCYMDGLDCTARNGALMSEGRISMEFSWMVRCEECKER